jgi:hypothetical protein
LETLHPTAELKHTAAPLSAALFSELSTTGEVLQVPMSSTDIVSILATAAVVVKAATRAYGGIPLYI